MREIRDRSQSVKLRIVPEGPEIARFRAQPEIFHVGVITIQFKGEDASTAFAWPNMLRGAWPAVSPGWATVES